MTYEIRAINSVTRELASGLTPTFLFFVNSANQGVAAPVITELGGRGVYQFTYIPSVDISFRVDLGSSMASTDRYIEGVLSPADVVTLAAVQPNYAPAKAGDAMTLTPTYDAAKANVMGQIVDEVQPVLYNLYTSILDIPGNLRTELANTGLNLPAIDLYLATNHGHGPWGMDVTTASEVSLIRKMATNKAVISSDGLTVTIYDDDGVTPVTSYAISENQKTRTPL